MFQATRGTNISHWLSQSGKRGEDREAFFGEVDIQRMAAWGFDHLRLPIDEEQMWDEVGRKHEDAWKLMDQCLDWCDRAGLTVIVDLHILRSHYFNDKVEPRLFTDPAEAIMFARMWEQLSDHLRGRSVEKVAYELMNEAVARNAKDWNRVAHTAFSAIRQREASRVIILGSNKWNQCATFDQLEVPDDPNQILTFHFYNPMLVTHYRATWTDCGKYAGAIHYPGLQVLEEDQKGLDAEVLAIVKRDNRHYDRAAMLADMDKPLAVRDRTGLPLYCGEFGCINRCPDEVRFAWYRDLISIFKQERIGWGNWDYKGSFGLIDGDGKSTGIAEVMLSV